MKSIKFLPILLFIILIFRYFVSTHLLIAHDWPLSFRESRHFSPFWSISWDYMGNGGIGGAAFKTLWIDLYTNFVYFISNSVNIPWWLSQRIFWLVPFLIINLFSSYKLSGLFIKDSAFRVLSSIIYTFNTYILLIIGGGQFGIAFAYALSPLTLFYLIKLFRESNLKLTLISGLFSGLLIALDPRVSFLVFVIGLVWYLFFIRNFSLRKLSYIFGSLIIAILLNSYWVLPAGLFFLSNSASSIISSYTSLPGVKFLSFATFENSLSFLHPNWPENIFGKIYFQRPEFLILPILAFSVLVFKVKKEILFFVVLGLFGIFLAKGANDPFGGIYLFLFQHVPGFNLFRDPTKFYILIAISYSILIPFFLENLSLKFNKYKLTIYFSFLFILLFLLRSAWNGELTGVFKPTPIPSDYAKLAEVIKADEEFSRTLWIPRKQKYGFFNPTHPAIDSEVVFKGKKIDKIPSEQLSDLSVRYVVVPYDSDGEIFLKDRKYDDKIYNETIRKVESAFGQNQTVGFGKVIVYRIDNPKEHFWSPSSVGIKYKSVNPSHYEVSVQNAHKGDILIFSEGFDKNWIAEGSGFKIQSSKFGNFNSFVLPQDGDYNLSVIYQPQQWVNIGLSISALALAGLIFSFLVLYFRHDSSRVKSEN